MLKYLTLALSLLILSNVSFSQEEEEDEYCSVPNKKVMKLIRAAHSPKADFRERSMNFIDAIELDDEKAYSYFVYAEYLFERANEKYEAYKIGRANFVQVRNQFRAVELKYLRVVELCADFHASAYYKLGFINYYIKEDKEVGKDYFTQFINYNHDDLDRFPEEYTEWKSEVTELLTAQEKVDNYAKEFYDKRVLFHPVQVKNVSTSKDEYLPMISPDNELIFYTRRGDERTLGELQSNVREVFSVSQRKNVKSDFNVGEGLSRPFNTKEYNNYGGVSLSIDNKEMFICACKDEVVYGKKYPNCDIYVSYFKRSGKGGYDFSWTALKNLGPNINTNDGWEAQPSLWADGNTLYFSAYRKNTRKTDIYFSTRKEEGEWSVAKPLAGPINTDGHDKAPFLHQDSETMYFVSQVSETRKGAGKPGNYDVFFSRKGDDGAWSNPKNIGYPINTEDNELGLIVSTDGKLAYFATDKEKAAKGVDLYYFELYEEARPQKVLFVKGELKDEDGEAIQDATVEINYKETGESIEVKINGDDGKFAAVIKTDKPQDVLLSVKKKGHSFDTKVITKKEVSRVKLGAETFKDELVAMEIGELKLGKSFTIDNILFATNSYELSGDAKFVLNRFIAFLKENPTVEVEIEGHTDDYGNDSENMTLSEDRADATMNYIISKGISEDRLAAYGYGETQPKVPNANDRNRAKNRRTDFKLTGL